VTKYILTILLLLGWTISHAVVADEPVAVGQTKIDDYLMRFHRNVSEINETRENVVSSPLGTARIGEMLFDGADGKTKEALRQAFLTTTTRTTIKGEVTKETENWFRLPKENANLLPFVSVDGLWLQKGFAFLPTYVSGLQEKFAPEITEADFAENADAECTKINAWVAKATEGKIETLFEKVDADTKLVVANAISFHGQWDTPFDPKDTKTGPWVGGLKSVGPPRRLMGPFMHKTMRVGYMENDVFQAVELPYERNLCSMIVILPRESDGQTKALKEVETLFQINTVSEMIPELVDIRLPKFEIESEIDLKAVLSAMGAEPAFDPAKADFSPMNGSGGLYVGQAKQKVFIRVDESGTEAAAATGAAVGLKSRPPEEVTPKTFHANRPFLFIIRENSTNTPLFIGRLAEPTSPLFQYFPLPNGGGAIRPKG